VRLRAGLFALGLLAPLLVACAPSQRATGPVTDVQPAERPPRGSDEADLWAYAEQSEEQLRNSPQVVRDPQLHSYIREIVCRLAGPLCADMRVYVVRNPAFYAAMAPNGTMQVWTGLLLRAANEAQLAFVLGHEIGHYVRRHSRQRWDDFQAKAIDLGRERAGMAAFSREHEREADQLSFDLMVKAGYDPREAGRAWDRLLDEPGGRATPRTAPFLATHPPTAERLAALRDYAEYSAVLAAPRIGREDYQAQLRRVRGWLLHDEVRRRQFGSTERLLRLLIEDGEGLGELHFHVGELHRLRSGPGDLPKAIAAYQRALQLPDVPPETWRGLGLTYLRIGEPAAAREALGRYLERHPDAADRELIRDQLAALQASR
jgi:predicted Zn-dependent protease